MNNTYFGMEFLGVFVMLILLYANSFESKTKTNKNRIFNRLLITNVIVVSADALTWLDLGWERSPRVFWILISLTYILPFLMLGTFARYLYAHISEKSQTSRKPFVVAVILSILTGIVSIGLCSTGRLFDIKGGFFHPGPYEPYYYALYMATLLFMVGIIIYHGPKLGLRDSIVALSYSVLPLLSLIFSMNNLQINLSVPFMSVDVLIIYMVLQSDRERNLFYQSNYDELTGLLNRKSYEENLIQYPDVPPELDFVYASIDINSLKQVNDTCGHQAGDELIRGAAYCLKQTFGNYGRVFRTGGDEFVAIFFVDDARLKNIIDDLATIADEWKGKLADGLTLSVGYVQKKEFPDLTVREMAGIADKRMYRQKELYYQNKGVDRRGQSAAYKILCSVYTKILKVNITDDTFSIIRMDEGEMTSEQGYSDRISEWIEGFAKSGNVHPEDLDDYYKVTSIEYLRDYFHENKTSLTVFYRRKYGDEFKRVMMELIPSEEYRDDNQILFLYVKNIDK